MRARAFLLSLTLMFSAVNLEGATVAEFLLHPEFPQTVGKQPQGVALGPDDNLWIAEYVGNAIVRVNAGGVRIGTYAVPTSNAQPIGIAPGPDGALWFTEYGSGQIGRITTAGAVTEYPLPSAGSQPYFICAGPDGAMWFTEFAGERIGRITMAGVVTEFTAGGGPTGIAAGPDGALWFTEYSGGKIGRITTAGALTEFPIPTPDAAPYDIAAGPDGNLWFTESAAAAIGRLTPAGVFTEFPTPTRASAPSGILRGVDGQLWFAERTTSRIGVVSTAGEFAELPIPATNSQPAGLALGPAGTMWFTESATDRVGRITLSDPLIEYAIPGSGAATPQALALVRGPDGQIWFATSDSRICRIVTTGSVKCFAVSGLVPSALAPGSDGALWFGDYGYQIGRMTVAGAITRTPLPGSCCYITAMTLGTDGNVWYFRGNSYGRATPAASMVEWPVSLGFGIVALAAGPDGNIWAAGYGAVYRLGLTGSTASFPVTGTNTSVSGITAGPDGNLWYANGSMGRITPTGLSTSFPLDGQYYTGGVTSGPDGNLWTVAGSRVYRVDTAGTILNRFPYGAPNGYNPGGNIAVGPSNTIWWADASLGAIGKLTITSATAPLSFHTLTPCRLLDTRAADGPLGGPPLFANQTRTFVALGSCGIPLSARVLSVNLTAVTSGLGIGYPFNGDLVAYAGDLQPAPASANSISYRSGRDRANNAIVQLSTDGSGAFAVLNRGYVPVHLVVDVNGWFE